MSMIDDIEKVFYTQQELQQKVNELGAQITKDYEGKEPIFVGVLKGCFVFMADLMRAVNLPCQIDFMAVSSYGSGTTSSGNVQITKDLRMALPTITGKPTSSYPEDSRYRTEVHVPGRTFQPRTEPMDFKFIAPNWILEMDMAIHCALGRIKEEYKGCPISPDLFTVSRRNEDGEII